MEKKSYLKAAVSELYFGHFGERDSLILNHWDEDQPVVNGRYHFAHVGIPQKKGASLFLLMNLDVPASWDQRLGSVGFFHPNNTPYKKLVLIHWSYPSWWFQPILENISQIGSSPQLGVKIKNLWNHHLVTIDRKHSWPGTNPRPGKAAPAHPPDETAKNDALTAWLVTIDAHNFLEPGKNSGGKIGIFLPTQAQKWQKEGFSSGFRDSGSLLLGEGRIIRDKMMPTSSAAQPM